MCRVLRVSAQGYYAWKQRPESKRDRANRELLVHVLNAAEELGFDTRGPEIGVRGNIWSGVEHIHIGNHHIPVEPGFEP